MADEPMPASVAWNRVQNHLDKLFDSLILLDEAGGLRVAVEEGNWKPVRAKKALESLAAVRSLLDAEIRRPRGAVSVGK